MTLPTRVAYHAAIAIWMSIKHKIELSEVTVLVCGSADELVLGLVQKGVHVQRIPHPSMFCFSRGQAIKNIAGKGCTKKNEEELKLIVDTNTIQIDSVLNELALAQQPDLRTQRMRVMKAMSPPSLL